MRCNERIRIHQSRASDAVNLLRCGCCCRPWGSPGSQGIPGASLGSPRGVLVGSPEAPWGLEGLPRNPQDPFHKNDFVLGYLGSPQGVHQGCLECPWVRCGGAGLMRCNERIRIHQSRASDAVNLLRYGCFCCDITSQYTVVFLMIHYIDNSSIDSLM